MENSKSRWMAGCVARDGALDLRPAAALGILLVALLMLGLRAETARAADDVDFVCWDMADGSVDCATMDAFKAMCDLIDNENELCQIVLNNRAAPKLAANPGTAKPHLPANTRYVPVKLTRAEQAIWRAAKSSLDD